jgi:hypothetical protein
MRVLYVTYRKASLQDVNLNMTFAVTVWFSKQTFVCFKTPVTFVSFGFSRLFMAY